MKLPRTAWGIAAWVGVCAQGAEPRLALVEDQVPALMREHHVPGVAVALVAKCRITHVRAFGVRQTGQPDPVTPDTRFEACSLSKPVFAHAVLQVVQGGDWELDAPLGDPATARGRITTRQVLTHTAGLPNWRAGGWQQGPPPTPRHPPGTRYTYSGEGFLLLQQALEKQTGQLLDPWIQDRLLRPARMARSGYSHRPDWDDNTARGHDRDGNPLGRDWLQTPNAAFSLYTTAEDYARFLLLLMESSAPNPVALRPEWRNRMLRPAWRIPGEAEAYRSLGWMIVRRDGQTWVQHSGSNGTGFRCFARFNPETGNGLTIFTNAYGGDRLWPELIRRLDASAP